MFPDNIWAAFAAIDMTWLSFALAFIVLDVLTGIAKGAASHNLSSTVMRDGFWRKLGIIIVLIIAALVDAAAGAGLDLGFQVPLFEGVCGYVIVMEALSILENACEINPQLAGSRLIHFFDDMDEDKLVKAMPSNAMTDGEIPEQEADGQEVR